MRTVVLTTLASGASAFSQRPLGSLAESELQSRPASSSHRGWEEYIQDVMGRWHAPGVAVAVINGSETWTKGFGYASLDPPRPVTPHTLFYTGSTTKSFTAAGLSLLIDNSTSYSGVSWQTPISEVLREDFVLSDAWATEHITFEDTLSHRTGYPRHDLSIRNSTLGLVRSLRHLPMSAEPRTRFQYNNMMYGVAGYAIEKLTGLALGSFFRRHLWGPMGLNETFLGTWDPYFEQSGLELAQGYWWAGAARSYVPDSSLQHLGRADEAAGAVLSNAVDYVKYLRVMMAEDDPVSKGGHRQLKKPRSFMDSNPEMFIGPTTETYGLGWMGGVFEGEQAYWHTGTVNTFATFMLMVPARGFGIAVMANSNSKVRELVTYRVLYDLFGIGPDRRPDHESLFAKQEMQQQISILTCSERLFPHVPSPPLPALLPLANHTGAYVHPGYGQLFVDVLCLETLSPDTPIPGDAKNGGCRLVVRRGPDAQVQVVGMLEHKTGEYWLAYWALEEIPNVVLGCARTEFRVDVGGRVSHVGVDLRMEEDDTALVWFKRSEVTIG